MDDAVRKAFVEACRKRGLSESEMGVVESVSATVVFATMEGLLKALEGFGADLSPTQREMCVALVIDGLADNLLEVAHEVKAMSGGA